MNIDASALAIKALKAIWEADKANVYINPRDVTFILYVRTPDYEDEYLKFKPTPETVVRKTAAGDASVPITMVTLKQYGERTAAGRVINDGATKAPDWPKGVKSGATLHDPGYLSRMAIARAWANEIYNPGPLLKRDWITRLTVKSSSTWTPEDVRQLFDSIFAATIRAGGGRPFIVRTYYSFTRWFGGISSHISGSARLLLLVATLLTVTGCTNGCMSPPENMLDFPDGVPQPVQTQSGDLSGAVRELIKGGLHQ